MKKRVTSAIVLILIAIPSIFLSRFSRLFILTVAGVLCCYEYSHSVEKYQVYCCAWVMYTYITAQAVLLYFGRSTDSTIFIACFCLAVFLALLSGIINPKVSGKGVLFTLAGVSYPALCTAMILAISVSEWWKPVFILAILGSCLCDMFALFGGILFGKHKLAPHISPNKTLEGSACGAVASLLGGVVAWFLLDHMSGIHLEPHVCLVTCLISSTFGQIGDLAESLLKRTIDIKDFSDLIPGHGGVFDRIDSLMFAIPVTYLCLYLFRMV